LLAEVYKAKTILTVIGLSKSSMKNTGNIAVCVYKQPTPVLRGPNSKVQQYRCMLKQAVLNPRYENCRPFLAELLSPTTTEK